MKFNDETYDKLKWIAMIVMPAGILAFKTIGYEVGLVQTDMIANILTALNAFLGAILGISTAEYNKEN